MWEGNGHSKEYMEHGAAHMTSDEYSDPDKCVANRSSNECSELDLG